MTFGTLLRAHRRAAGYSLAAAAANLGVNKAYLSQVERDLRPPLTDATITYLAGAYDADADRLLSLARIARATLRSAIPERRRFIQSLILRVNTMSDEEYTAFVATVA